MIRGLYTAVSGLISQEARQDVITSNMANANTTGYKADNLVIKSFDDVLIENYDKTVDGKRTKNKIGSLSLGSEIDETVTDFTQGNITDTEEDTDFAIAGKGFFTLEDDNGNRYYTRDGHFHVDSRGFLKSENGYNVIGKDNNSKEGPIYVGNGKLQCDDVGNITADGQKMSSLYISDFQNYNSLVKAGDNLFTGDNATEATSYSLKNKALEKSNINVINEMVNMMNVMRTFETNQKMVQTLDETLGKAVNDIGSLR